MLFESACVYGLDPSIDAIDGDLRWCKSNDGAKSLVSCMYRSVVSASESHPENPCRTNRRRPMRIWDFGKRGQKCRIYNGFVDNKKNEGNDG